MATYRCTIFWHTDFHGWTETYFGQFTDFDTAGTAFISLAKARCALSAQDAIVDQLRVSNIDNVRDSFLIPPDTNYDHGTYEPTPLAGSKSNLSQDALLVELFANPAKKNRKFLRGIPDNLVQSNQFLPDTVWNAAYSIGPLSYRGILTGTPWYTQNFTKLIVPPVKTYQPITTTNIIRMVTRRVGRPFGVPVGRRKTRA